MRKPVTRKVAGEALKRAIPAIPALDALAVITAGMTYLNTREAEITKRAYIAAQRDVLVTAIKAEHGFLQSYMARRFDERKMALDQFFAILEAGVSARDLEVIDRALAGILGVLQDDPLNDLETFRRNWTDPGFVIDI